MNLDIFKEEFIQLSNKMNIKSKTNLLKDIEPFIPFFELIRKDNSVIIVKLDGERDDNYYTLIISGKELGDESIRMDTSDLTGGLAYVIVEYAKRVWNNI